MFHPLLSSHFSTRPIGDLAGRPGGNNVPEYPAQDESDEIPTSEGLDQVTTEQQTDDAGSGAHAVSTRVNPQMKRNRNRLNQQVMVKPSQAHCPSTSMHHSPRPLRWLKLMFWKLLTLQPIPSPRSSTYMSPNPPLPRITFSHWPSTTIHPIQLRLSARFDHRQHMCSGVQ